MKGQNVHDEDLFRLHPVLDGNRRLKVVRQECTEKTMGYSEVGIYFLRHVLIHGIFWNRKWAATRRYKQ